VRLKQKVNMFRNKKQGKLFLQKKKLTTRTTCHGLRQTTPITEKVYMKAERYSIIIF